MPRLSAGLPNPIVLGAILLHACGTAAPAATRSALDPAQIWPISEIIALAGSHPPGRVIKAGFEPLGLAGAYEISPLPPAGPPFEGQLDARSGAFLGALGLVQERDR